MVEREGEIMLSTHVGGIEREVMSTLLAVDMFMLDEE
jgi:hypothetical protein